MSGFGQFIVHGLTTVKPIEQREMKVKREFTHRELCLKASKYLRSKGIAPFNKCKYSVCELERIGECPDAFGWCSGGTQLIEVKVTRSDFLSEKNKAWRKIPHNGLGMFRSYLCPEGLIKEKDLPEKWGLLYVDGDGKINKVIEPTKQESNHLAEIRLLTSIMSREQIKPQVFSYKRYKNDKQLTINDSTNPKT